MISFFEFHGSKIQQYTEGDDGEADDTEGDDGEADDTEGDDNQRLMTAKPMTPKVMRIRD